MQSKLLEYITIEGFKSIASVEKLALRPINVLIGPNGSGKSNFMAVFAFLHEMGEGRLREYVTKAGGAEKVLHFGSKTTKDIFIKLWFTEKETEYELTLTATGDDGLFPSIEIAAYPENFLNSSSRLAPKQNGREANISDPGSHSTALRVHDYIGSWRLYHLHDTSSSSLRKTAKVDDNHFLRPDGSNLAAFLYFLQEKHETSYSLIRRTVQQVAPFFDDFQLRPRKLQPTDIRLEWRHKSSDQYFDASSLSDGTLRFIALATLFLQAVEFRPSVILVDEPELGLHPYAVGTLAALIRQASANTQVIVSTQSSLLLDHFEPEDVLVADRVNHSTQITRLDSKQLETWLKDYSLGQLWEKNELGGRPIPE